jgi:hypothetical protein
MDLRRRILLAIAISVCGVVLLPAQTPKTKAGSADILRSFKTVYVQSKTPLAKPEMLAGELQKISSFDNWGLSITSDPANAVVGVVPAGCNPVRLITSPRGEVAYVTARTDNALLAFDTSKLLTDSANALIARVPVGDAPVGVAVLNNGARLAVTNSNRFGNSSTTQSLSIIDAHKIGSGAAAILGTVPVGVFPRELRVTEDERTLLLTNFGSKTLAVIDVARLPLEPRKR